MIARHAVRSANRQALIAAAQHLAAASSAEDTDVAMAALREALVPYADRERTMRPPKATPEPEERSASEPLIRFQESAAHAYMLIGENWFRVLPPKRIAFIGGGHAEFSIETTYGPVEA